MSSGPLQYDFPNQLVQMASIPNTQANTALTQAQTAQIRQQTNYQAWLNSLVQNMQNTPPNTMSAGMAEPTLTAPDASAMPPAAASPAASAAPAPTGLVSSVPYAVPNAGNTAPASAPANTAPASSGGAGSVTGSVPTAAAPAPQGSPAPPVTPSGDADLDSHELATGGKFDRQQLFNKTWAEYGVPRSNPQMMSLPGVAGDMYRQQYAATVKANELRSYQDIEKMQSVASAPQGKVFAAYDQVYGTQANPHPSVAIQGRGVTEDQLKNEMWVAAHIVNHAAQLPVDKLDNGSTITYVNPHNNQPMFGLGTVNKVLTPEAAQTAKTAAAGQSYTAISEALKPTTVQNAGGGTSVVPAYKIAGAAGTSNLIGALNTNANATGNAPPTNNLIRAAAPATAPTPNAASSAPGMTPVSMKSGGDPWSAVPKYAPASGVGPQTTLSQEYDKAVVAKDTATRDALSEQSNNANSRLQFNSDAAANLQKAATGPAADFKTYLRQVGVNTGLITQKQADEAASTIVLNKDLTQNALMAGKLMFGSRYTNSEVGIMLTKANASGTMPPEAIHELLVQDNLRSGYAVQKQADYDKFTGMGGDPRKFDSWYNTNFPLQKYVNTNRSTVDASLKQQEGTTQAAPAPKAMPAGTKMQTYAATHFDGDTGKAQAYLASQGYK